MLGTVSLVNESHNSLLLDWGYRKGMIDRREERGEREREREREREKKKEFLILCLEKGAKSSLWSDCEVSFPSYHFSTLKLVI